MSDDKVVTFTGATTLDLPVQKLVENIEWEELDTVMVLAEDKEGEFRVYSNKAEVATMILMMERAKFNLLAGVYET